MKYLSGITGTTIKDTWTKSRGRRVKVGEGGGFSWGGVEGWGETAYNCNWITIKIKEKKEISFSIPLLLVCVYLLFWGGFLENRIYIGLVFLSIQLPSVFCLEHLSHLHLKWLLMHIYWHIILKLYSSFFSSSSSSPSPFPFLLSSIFFLQAL